jgi:hypothetical protein
MANGSKHSVHRLTGIYTNPGYGTFELCSSQSSSAQCNQTLADFDAIPNATRDASSSLYTSWTRLWASHFRLTRQNDTTFILSPLVLFPNGYGSDTSPWAYEDEDDSGARLEFVLGKDGNVEGFGLFGLVGEVTERERLGNTIEERAEVWFKRV